jgi:hypothetical protein
VFSLLCYPLGSAGALVTFICFLCTLRTHILQSIKYENNKNLTVDMQLYTLQCEDDFDFHDSSLQRREASTGTLEMKARKAKTKSLAQSEGLTTAQREAKERRDAVKTATMNATKTKLVRQRTAGAFLDAVNDKESLEPLADAFKGKNAMVGDGSDDDGGEVSSSESDDDSGSSSGGSDFSSSSGSSSDDDADERDRDRDGSDKNGSNRSRKSRDGSAGSDRKEGSDAKRHMRQLQRREKRERERIARKQQRGVVSGVKVLQARLVQSVWLLEELWRQMHVPVVSTASARDQLIKPALASLSELNPKLALPPPSPMANTTMLAQAMVTATQRNRASSINEDRLDVCERQITMLRQLFRHIGFMLFRRDKTWLAIARLEEREKCMRSVVKEKAEVDMYLSQIQKLKRRMATMPKQRAPPDANETAEAAAARAAEAEKDAKRRRREERMALRHEQMNEKNDHTSFLAGNASATRRNREEMKAYVNPVGVREQIIKRAAREAKERAEAEVGCKHARSDNQYTQLRLPSNTHSPFFFHSSPFAPASSETHCRRRRVASDWRPFLASRRRSRSTCRCSDTKRW